MFHKILLPVFVVAILTVVRTFALAGLVNLIAQIHTRGEHAAKFEWQVGLHVEYTDRVFIKVKIFLTLLRQE